MLHGETVDQNCHTRFKNLVRLGVNEYQARMVAGSRKGPWAMSNMKPLKIALSNRFFAGKGFSSLLNQHQRSARLYEPPCTDPYARWCGRVKVVRPSPIPIVADQTHLGHSLCSTDAKV